MFEKGGLGVLLVPLILQVKLVRPSVPRSSYVPFSVWSVMQCLSQQTIFSILCTCCSHFCWYCSISFTMFCAPVFFLILVIFPYLISSFLVSVSKISTLKIIVHFAHTVHFYFFGGGGESQNKQRLFPLEGECLLRGTS